MLCAQVSSSRGLNITFVEETMGEEEEGDVMVFLDANEEILQGDRLFLLCSHAYYRMNPFQLAQAVALQVAPLVHEACMNKDEMMSESMDVEEDHCSRRKKPDWWLCSNQDDDDDDGKDMESMIPIVRVHPMHAEDNERLCVECRGIFEDPELYWPFLDRAETTPYNGWVDFVIVERRLHNKKQQQQQQLWLCAKLLDKKQVVY